MAVSRKTVTVLFADVADSTALGEQLDPETLRGALGRWFDEARAVIERHGGTVEKYVGDSVMAVFGIPQLHEDDAVRAVRAADELNAALAKLNMELHRERGLRFTVRIGINTGEVVTGDGGATLVTGDAVNVAKRFEEAGDGGDVIVGATTYGLARAAAEFEPLAPLALKGKSGRVPAWRLVAVDRDGVPYERRLDTPLVGRKRELEQLRRAFRRSVEERTCHLFTLLGTAGIGKTRLACELFDEFARDAIVLRGRCLPYGDGITFWPLHDVIRELGGEDEVLRLLSGNDDAELICERLTGEPGSQEVFWAVRRLCETLAGERPLILCFEDVHWAEPTFLDLIEYLAGWIRDAPMLLLCIARPEFMDERPAWISGQENAASLTLAPLSPKESQQLVDQLGVDDERGKRIADAAEGNPLYAEQMAAMIAEGGDVAMVPPTIQALLAARLDRLTAAERAVIECAAVCGKEFWRDAVTMLANGVPSVGSLLLSLVRKELIRAHRSSARPDDAFRFAHVLIRDAAYAATPRERRARLHELFARWLETESESAALGELVGYHLEQAYRNREALGPADDTAVGLAIRAGELLADAGERAAARNDIPAAVNLLGRAADLLPADHPSRGATLSELASALMRSGDFAPAENALNQALTFAASTGDRSLEQRTLIEREFFRAFTNPQASTDGLVQVAENAIPVLEELGDDLGLAKAWWLRSEPDVISARWEARAAALERALEHAQRAGDLRDQASIIGALAQALEYGPTPVSEAIRRCEELHAIAPDDAIAIDAAIDYTLAALRAMEGQFDVARDLYAKANAQCEQLGLLLRRATRALDPAYVELLADNPEGAARELRGAYDALERMGERGVRSTIAAFLAQALVAANRLDEAQQFTQISEEAAETTDIVAQAVWRSARARCLAEAGKLEEAEARAREAVELASGTDFLDLQATTMLDLAQVLSAAGRTREVPALVEAARERYRRKGNVVLAERAAEFLAEAAR